MADVNRSLLNRYIVSLNDGRRSLMTQRSIYSGIKAVLKALCIRGKMNEISAGDDATFPPNPFTGVERYAKGEEPLSRNERKAFAQAVKCEVMSLFDAHIEPTATLVSFALLIVALHTGRNTFPLLEMERNCFRAHPKADTLFLVLYKRRGHSTSKVAVRNDRKHDKICEFLPSVRPTVSNLISRVLELTEELKNEAPEALRNRVWLHRKQSRGAGTVDALNANHLYAAIKFLIKKHELKDSGGKPLRVNLQRLRKTFVNRVYEIVDGDVVATAAAAGHSPRVSDVSYLRPGQYAQSNWKFMGHTLVQELLSSTVGTTEKTPVGRCSDPKNGDYAPKLDGKPCMSFLNCVRCRDYVVTGDDLYRLFSFYWRILHERASMTAEIWQRQLAHIVRLIDRDVVAKGLETGVFKQDVLERERERARNDPHPFWCSDAILTDISKMTA